MTLSELHSNDTLRRHEFPSVDRSVFMAHAGVCPLPRRTKIAMQEYLEQSSRLDQETANPPGLRAETRKLAAQLIHAHPDEIAFVGPTSLALSYVASGLRWRRGDNVLIYYDDYPSNVYPWMALADRGVQVRMINLRELGRIRPIDVVGQVDEGTKLVALASGHYLSGWRLEHDAIGKALQDRNILFCLDGIQTVGAFPTSVEHVDFLAADAHKWMLGPCAAGILYVRKEIQNYLDPIVHGWHNLECPHFLTQEELVWKTDARRYEVGTHDLTGIVGMRESIRLILELGVENIGNYLAQLRQHAAAILRSRGYTVVNPEPPLANLGSITSFYHASADMKSIHAHLEQEGYSTSLRHLPGGQLVIRLAPHFYNTKSEIDQLISLLPQM